jgi:hypothetical protein
VAERALVPNAVCSQYYWLRENGMERYDEDKGKVKVKVKIIRWQNNESG